MPLQATGGVNSTTHRTHFTHANMFLRVAQGAEEARARFVSLCLHSRSSSSRVMSHAQSLWSDFPLFPLPQYVSSLLHPSHSEESCDPRRGGQCGRLAEQKSSHTSAYNLSLQFLIPPLCNVRFVCIFLQFSHADLQILTGQTLHCKY